jgi:hypothetical protein
MNINIKCFLLEIFFLITVFQLNLFAQCTPGPYTVDPASAELLDCQGQFTTFSDPCNRPPFPPFETVLLDIPSGTQVCVELPASGRYVLSTCRLTTDETSITVFDVNGVEVPGDDLGCGNFTFANQGDVICIQVESLLMGVCQGTSSTSASYQLEISCPNEFTYEQIFTDPIACDNIGFNELITLTAETGLPFDFPVTDSATYAFNTGLAPSTGQYSSGSLTVCAQGELSFSNNIWIILDENLECFGGLGGVPTELCGEAPICTSFNFDEAQISSMVADDGVVTFIAAQPGTIMDDFCPENFLSLELTLCSQIEEIPTMSEWGLICLGLVLLCFGVVAIRQKQVVFKLNL